MVKLLPLLLLSALLFAGSLARSTFPPQTQPHVLESLELKTNQIASNYCPYKVIIKTSCSSPSYTRDRVSLAFGDAYGGEVYAQRLDDPRSGTFERCSGDTFEINGPCTRDICYLYLLRKGSDGWIPESVKIAGNKYTRGASFYFNKSLPNGVWFGFNLCPRHGHGHGHGAVIM